MKLLSYNVLAESTTHHLKKEGIDPIFLEIDKNNEY
jgi:hypothetical protein